MLSEKEIYKHLQDICDPEVPVLSILDLGIVRKVYVEDNKVVVTITPTYSGCPAMNVIATSIKLNLISVGCTNVSVEQVLSPAWTTDWMTQEGKQKLKNYGIAPPQYKVAENLHNTAEVNCPICNSSDTQIISAFGSTSCKSLYKCNACLEPFDYFKCH